MKASGWSIVAVSNMFLKFLLLYSLIILIVSGQSTSLASFSRSSAVYVVKFFRATTEQLQNLNVGLPSNRKILSQLQFLEKLVRNTTEVLTQAVFYVNFTIPQSIANSSNFNGNINNTITQKVSNTEFSNSSTNRNISQRNNNIKNSNIISNNNLINNTEQSTLLANGSNNSRDTNKNNPIQDIKSRDVANESFIISSELNQSTLQIGLSSTLPPSLGVKNQEVRSTGIKVEQLVKTLNSRDAFKNIQNSITTKVSNNSFFKRRSLPLKQILNTEFNGIGLFHTIPEVFAKNEVFRFHGIVTDISTQSNTFQADYVAVLFTKKQSNDEIKCIQKITLRNLQFQISCKLDMQGIFFLSIYYGSSGIPSPKFRQIKQQFKIPQPSITPPKPQSLYLEIVDGNLYVNWNAISPLTKISFTQKNKTLQYLLSNFHYRFNVPYYDFTSFVEGQTNVSISHAESKNASLLGISSYFGNKLQLQFFGVQHKQNFNREEWYTIFSPIPQQIKANTSFIFSASFKASLRNQLYLVSPLSQLKSVYFFEQFKNNPVGIINSKTNLSLTISFTSEGTNLIQINQDGGLAIINQAVYVGNCFPLIPDYSDIKLKSIVERTNPVPALQKYLKDTISQNIQIKQPNRNSSLTQKRIFMLKLVNILRSKDILNPVYMDEKLTLIAQSHSDDMRKYSYFSHTNLNNEGSSERAIRFGFRGAIGENIAQSDSLVEAHMSLHRSAAHLQNTLSKTWTRVGIGINQTLLGQYLVTFIFSSRDIVKDPLQKFEIEAQRKSLVQMILRKFSNIKSQNTRISTLVTQWMTGARSIPIRQYLQSKGIKKTVFFTTIRFTYYPNFISDIQKNPSILGDRNKNQIFEVGIGIIIGPVDPTMMQCNFVFAS